MSNEFGYFKYLDIAPIETTDVAYSSDTELQQDTFVKGIGDRIVPFEYASFEQDAYDTENPKLLYRNKDHEDYGWTSSEIIRWRRGLDFLTSNTSDMNGVLYGKNEIICTFPDYISFKGLTLYSRVKIPHIRVFGYNKENEEILEVELWKFSTKEIVVPFVGITETETFFSFDFEQVYKIVIEFDKIEEPNHFLWITGIEFGKITRIDDKDLVDVEIKNTVSVLGDKLEYDTLDFDIFTPQPEYYTFRAKQQFQYITGYDEENLSEIIEEVFYIDDGNTKGNATYLVRAYDGLSLLETEFLGGMYNNYSLSNTIGQILKDTGVYYDATECEGITLTGYLPISTRRKALQTVLLASNVRCFREGYNLVFKPISKELNTLVLNDTNIVENPNITEKLPIDKFVLNYNTYSKSNERIEVFNGEVERYKEVTIHFSEPVNRFYVYEVTGTDGDGNDIVSNTQSQLVEVRHSTVNGCVLWYSGTNKLVIYGYGYIKNEKIMNIQQENKILGQQYKTVQLKLSIFSDLNTLANYLFELYSRPRSIKFLTTEKLELGGYYNILGNNLNIKSIRNSFNGLYEIEAV